MNRKTQRPRSLSPEALAHVRTVVEAMAGSNGGPVPHDQVVALTQCVDDDVGVTIDFPAANSAGVPIVILRVQGRPLVDTPLDALSPRESSIARLVAEGLSNKEIAGRLGISLATVKDHVHRILEKTGLPNRAAVAVAYTYGVAKEG